jgi:hypothetical protein
MALTPAQQRVVDGTTWRAFCDALKEAGDAILRASTPGTPLDRAEGIRYLTRLLRAGLESQLEFGDPRFPGFYQLSNETIKIGNDNPDNYYQNATVSGRYEYRISGTRGTVPYLSIGTKSGGYAADGSMAPTGQIDSRNLQVRPDGSFEIIVSCREHPDNWLPMKPETTNLIVRQTFLDRDREEVARLKIERIDPEGTVPLEPEALEQALARAVSFVRATANKFVDWMGRYSAHINQLPSDDQQECQRSGGDANIHYLQSYWRLEPDEALLIEARRIPECTSWNLQISNYWMESLDYRHHRIHVNKHTAIYEPDGSVRIVLAHRDPGPRWPNWLETVGHREGGMLFRWIEAKEHPGVDTRVVKFADLATLR